MPKQPTNQKILEAVERVAGDVSVLKENVTALKTDVTLLKSNMEVVKTDLAGLKTDVTVLKSNMEVVKTDLAGLKTDVPQLQVAVVSMQADLDEKFMTKDEFHAAHREVMGHLDGLYGQINLVTQEQTAGRHRDDRLEERLTRVERHVGLA